MRRKVRKTDDGSEQVKLDENSRDAMMASDSTVIIGCGIIGCATAYYLSLNDEHRTIHIVDSSPALFENVASGKSAGFLAKNWFSAPVAELGELSFDLHKKLAEEFGGRIEWGWSQSLSFGLNTSENTADDQGLGDEWDWSFANSSRAKASSRDATADRIRQGRDLSWLKSSNKLDPLSEPGTTAQV
jgi:glycine/D-amino acid oxidase-like deaminating enzyme